MTENYVIVKTIIINQLQGTGTKDVLFFVQCSVC